MKVNAIHHPLTLFYDAACPVCALEMDHLRARNAAGLLAFVDISAADFEPASWGFSRAELDAEIHAVDADGTVHRGMPVLREAYAAVGLGWVLRPTGLAPLRPIFDFGYRHFARHRRAISRTVAPLIEWVRCHRARRLARAMANCRGGACAVHGAASHQHKETS
jgi:predicted DCC family thiol-disulfide oxidoreductase YuxK